jgi:tRNA threonylcarbamoyladenosine modification (KEOPS) complex Cgi121 subunit
VIFQIFASRRTPNPAAVKMLAAQTLAAADSGATLAKKPELDLLLRLAGTRQIGEAIERCGYKSGKGRLFLVAASEEDVTTSRVSALDPQKFRRVKDRALSKGDLEFVERAALLSAEA